MNEHKHEHNPGMPQGALYDAVTLTDLIMRFVAYLEIYDEETLELAANWLQGALREAEANGADAVRDAYILTTAIDALRDAAEARNRFESTMLERTPQLELEALKVSLARVAQSAFVETEDLCVLGKSYVELLAFARANVRGWNTLASHISDKLDNSAKQWKAARKHAIERIKIYLSAGTVEAMDGALTSAAALFDLDDAESHYYKLAVTEFNRGNRSITQAHISAVELLLKQGGE